MDGKMANCLLKMDEIVSPNLPLFPISLRGFSRWLHVASHLSCGFLKKIVTSLLQDSHLQPVCPLPPPLCHWTFIVLSCNFAILCEIEVSFELKIWNKTRSGVFNDNNILEMLRCFWFQSDFSTITSLLVTCAKTPLA